MIFIIRNDPAEGEPLFAIVGTLDEIRATRAAELPRSQSNLAEGLRSPFRGMVPVGRLDADGVSIRVQIAVEGELPRGFWALPHWPLSWVRTSMDRLAALDAEPLTGEECRQLGVKRPREWKPVSAHAPARGATLAERIAARRAVLVGLRTD